MLLARYLPPKSPDCFYLTLLVSARGTAYISGRDQSAGEASLETPCVNVCLLDDGLGLCVGCGRTMEEISRWAAMSDQERRAVMAMLPARLANSEKAES